MPPSFSTDWFLGCEDKRQIYCLTVIFYAEFFLASWYCIYFQDTCTSSSEKESYYEGRCGRWARSLQSWPECSTGKIGARQVWQVVGQPSAKMTLDGYASTLNTRGGRVRSTLRFRMRKLNSNILTTREVQRLHLWPKDRLEHRWATSSGGSEECPSKETSG